MSAETEPTDEHESIAALGERAIKLLDLAASRDAILQYQLAVSKNPDYAEAYYGWGEALAQIERYQEAILQYQLAVSKNPDYAEAYYRWGEALAQLKRYEEALEQYGEALEKDPQRGRVRL